MLLGIGLPPGLATAAWGQSGAPVLLDAFGALGQADESLLEITHVPWVLRGRNSVTSLVLPATVGAAWTAAGLAGPRRRDLG